MEEMLVEMPEIMGVGLACIYTQATLDLEIVEKLNYECAILRMLL